MSKNRSTNVLHSNVVELRRYLLHPGQRDTLIELFDAEFLETQESLGIEVLGQFRDDDHPDTFLWFRGFTDMASRRAALAAFYGGPCWAEHRNTANATMIDSDNVLLLAPVPGHSFPLAERSASRPRGFHVVTLHLEAPATTAATSVISRSMDNDRLIALLVTLDEVNDFPALPVREGEHVIVAVVVTDASDDRPPCDFDSFELGQTVTRTEVFRLAPSDRSRLR